MRIVTPAKGTTKGLTVSATTPTTDRRPPRRSPAWRAKIATIASSATAVLAIVAGLTATAQKQEAVQTHAPTGGAADVPSADAGPTAQPAPVTAVPVPVPAPGPARITATPDGISRASGG